MENCVGRTTRILRVLEKMHNHSLPVLKLLGDSFGIGFEVLSISFQSLHSARKIILSVLQIAEQIDDVSDGALRRDHAAGDTLEVVHAFLRIKESKSTNVRTMLQIRTEIL